MVLDLSITTLITPRLPASGKKNALLFISRADASGLVILTLLSKPQLQLLAFLEMHSYC